jgi:ABC-type glutathione transport system ATPase component
MSLVSVTKEIPPPPPPEKHHHHHPTSPKGTSPAKTKKKSKKHHHHHHHKHHADKQPPETPPAIDLEDGEGRIKNHDQPQEPSNRRDRGSALFAERDGHTMKFEHLVMTTKSKNPKKRPPKTILKDVSGHVPPGKVTAIMGPSGSGKTSLLKILTGRAGAKNFHIAGQVKLDGRTVDPTNIEVRREIAYVEQEISIPATSTPREAVRFSARLRLDRSISTDEIERLVDEILEELGLEACADTMIGGGVMMSGGLSGGEKKRTQCGVELVTKPGIIILDGKPKERNDSNGPVPSVLTDSHIVRDNFVTSTHRTDIGLGQFFGGTIGGCIEEDCTSRCRRFDHNPSTPSHSR